MANEEHLAILKQGVDVWNAWREANPDIWPDLTRADLRGMDLTRINLSGVDLTRAELGGAELGGADLTRAILRGADLKFMDLTGADLSRTDLFNADLSGAVLNGAILSSADLSGADLSDTHLSKVDLTNTRIGWTYFVALDLNHLQGLESVEHAGPSYISIDTLIRSKGKISEAFLRGCGVPGSMIEYLPSILGAMEPIQFYSCFISYSTKDEEFAKRLHSKMRDNNLRVWFANEDLKGGHKLHEQIDEAIRIYDKIVLVLSPQSLRSKWVMSEVRRARKAELANNQRKFFPIRLVDFKEIEAWECIDPDTGTDLAAEIREYYIPDFRKWKDHDSFEREFAKLLEGLKAVDAPPAPRIEPSPNGVLVQKKRRLAILEEQQSTMGLHTPPHIRMEIEDLRKDIAKLAGDQ